MNRTQMKLKPSHLAASLCAIALLLAGASAVRAQGPEVKEKPPMYTYYASWVFPRARWADLAKPDPANEKILNSGVAAGTLWGFGYDETIVHQVDGPTHDNWWSAGSMAGVLDALDTIMKGAPSPLLASATMHADQILVSRYYNWHAGSYKGVYTHTSSYKLKADAPNDAVESISKAFIVPLMEKLLAAGAIIEYEIDQEAVHTESNDVFWVDYVSPTSAGLDQANEALTEALKTNPMAEPALGSMLDFAPHRDYLFRGNATFK